VERVPNLLGEFLRARRELTRPEDHGLPVGRRRVPGLRREEVAMLAGISAEYYLRLERGRDRHPSAQVVEALARVLDLDDESTAYLASLATPAPRASRRPRRGPERVPPEITRLLDGMPGVPAFVLGRCMDVLAHNRLAELLFGGVPGDGNMVRHVFLDPAARAVYPDWSDVAGGDRSGAAGVGRGRPGRPAARHAGRRAVGEERGVPHAVGAPRRPREDLGVEAAGVAHGG